MKKLLLLALMVLFIGIIVPSKAHAADISVGATTWYTWWNVEDEDGDVMDIDPTFLFGPVLSVKFNDDLNLTFVYLYGKFDSEVDDGTGSKSKLTIKRRDSDLALNYRLNDFFKLFGGIKYMSYSFSVSDVSGKEKTDHGGFGPGLGLSASFPIFDNLFLLGNISVMYLLGDEKYVDVNNESFKSTFEEYGINSSLSIAYYIEPASTVISLGGRYQYYKSVYDDDSYYINYKFYGITLTATYNFSI